MSGPGRRGEPLEALASEATERKTSSNRETNSGTSTTTRGGGVTPKPRDGEPRAFPPQEKASSGRAPLLRILGVVAGIVGLFWLADQQAGDRTGPIEQRSANPPRATAPPSLGGNDEEVVARYVPPARRPTITNAVDAPVHIAPGIVWIRSGMPRVAPFRVVTPEGRDYFVKLVDATSGRDVVALFVRGGQPLDVDVPLGNYRMRYASGAQWRGERQYFGPGEMTQFSEAATTFRFFETATAYEGHVVELIKQVGGNMATRDVSREGF